MSNERRTELFLDLEATVINNWWDGLLLHSNIDRINRIIEKDYPRITKIHIWSFAISDDADRREFMETMKARLQDVLMMEIDTVYTVEQIQQLVYKYERVQYDSQMEFIQLNGKFWSFVKFGQLYKNRNFVLFDDAVPYSLLTFPDLNTIIRTIKI